jgi:hypothetical protein
MGQGDRHMGRIVPFCWDGLVFSKIIIVVTMLTPILGLFMPGGQVLSDRTQIFFIVGKFSCNPAGVLGRCLVFPY